MNKSRILRGLSCFVIILFIFVIILVYIRDERIIESKRKQSSRYSCEIYENKSSSVIHAKTKKIAFGTSYLGVSGLWKKIFLRQTEKKCKTKCDVLFYKKDIPNADAVIFNANDLNKDKSIYNSYWVKKRKHHQVYVLFSMEAPPVVNYDRLEYYDNFFNWTMTYRRDSDVYFPFGLAIKRQTKNKIKYVTDKALFHKKTAVWFVSHCQTNSKREKFVHELKKYMDVDIYGNCGGKICGKSSRIITINNLSDDPCISVMKNYIFYLSFENSLCKDYITEKYFKSLKLGLIPVTYGGGNYSAISPPNSFIDYRDFKSVKDLANYMISVSKNATLYNSYLEWQEDYDIEVGAPYNPLVCELCQKLNEPYIHQSYRNISDWFTNKENCHKSDFKSNKHRTFIHR